MQAMTIQYAGQFPTSVRELSQEETAMIGGGDGGPTAGGLANAMAQGAALGALVGTAGGPPGMVAGAIDGAVLGGIGYAAGGFAETLYNMLF